MATASKSTGGNFKLSKRIKDPSAQVGFGHKLDGIGLGSPGFGSLVEEIRNRTHCPMLTMQNVEEVDWILDGPQSDANISQSFGAEIDPLHSGKSPAINGTVETTLALPGETQTHMIVCAVGWHLEPEPLCFTVRGNAWTAPTVGQAQPVSPDVFTLNDVNNGAFGAPIEDGAQFILPANYEHGWWANYAAWAMVKSYNLRWQIGQNTNLMFNSLRETAYMPPNAQDGTGSNSQVDVQFFVNLLNQYYTGAGIGSNQIFLPVDAIRIGSHLGTAETNVGVFRPSRDEELVDATYGGIGLREMLKGNSEYSALATPYMLGAGIPIGLIAEESDTDLANTMRQYLSVTDGFGGPVPPAIVPGANITAGGTLAGPAAFEEATLDGFYVPQQVNSQRVSFKGGRLKISVKIKGFEISEDLYTAMRNDSSFRDALCAECGIRLGQLGSR
jgi:hypothetical protein